MFQSYRKQSVYLLYEYKNWMVSMMGTLVVKGLKIMKIFPKYSAVKLP